MTAKKTNPAIPEGLGYVIQACLTACVIIPLVIISLLYVPHGHDGKLIERIDALEITVDALVQRMPTATETPQPMNANLRTGDVIVTTKPLHTRSILTTEEVADFLSCNADTVRRRAEAGQLVGFNKIGHNMWHRILNEDTRHRTD